MVFYHRTLSSFPSFQHQIECFLCHWKCKTKSYKCFLNLKSKGTKQRMQEEKEWYFVSNFVSRPPLLLTTISCSFFIHFEQSQRLQMCYLKIYKTCLKWKVNFFFFTDLDMLGGGLQYCFKFKRNKPWTREL